MTRSDFLAQLAEVLGKPRGDLSESDSRETVEGWSSIADVQILSLVQEQLGVDGQLELLEVQTVGELLDALEEQGAFNGA